MISRLVLGCALAAVTCPALAADRATIDALVSQHAAAHGVPESLIHRVIRRESNYNARAANRGNYGLMQIRHATARGMGYRGSASGLLDARTNMAYAVPYLANAYRVAGGNEGRAIALYSRGYYYEAKRRGMLARLRNGPAEEPEAPAVVAVAAPAQPSLFSALFGAAPAAPVAVPVAPSETEAVETAAVEERPVTRRQRRAARRVTTVERRAAQATRRAAVLPAAVGPAVVTD